jgi:hypothetical protein
VTAGTPALSLVAVTECRFDGLKLLSLSETVSDIHAGDSNGVNAARVARPCTGLPRSQISKFFLTLSLLIK